MGAAPDLPTFYGRQQELATLEQWIISDRYRSIAIVVGFAGIGKTSLVRGGIGKTDLFNSHALIKASAKDYVKDSQIRLILQPIIDRLNEMSLESQDSLKNRLHQLLSDSNRQLPGYTAGNLLNLMRYAGIDLSGCDFSQLTIWQADLQDFELHRVNFAGCQFANCSLTQDFGGIHAIALSPDGEILAGGDSQGKIHLYRVRDRLHNSKQSDLLLEL